MRHTAEQRSLSLIMDVAPGIPELPAGKRACKQMLLNDLKRHQVHRPRQLGACLGPARRRNVSSASPITASASPSKISQTSMPFVQANNSTIAAMTVPVSDCQW
jgi:hypothetical protein